MKKILIAIALVPLAGCAWMDGAANTNTQAVTAPVAPRPLTAEQKSEGIAKLNEVTAMLIDSNKLYGDAAELAKDSEFKAELATLARERKDQATNFQAHVRNIGGDPVTSGGPGGVWQSTIMNIASLGQNDTKAAVGQVLKADNGLVDKLNEDLSDPKLAKSTKQFLTGARDKISVGRDRVAALKAKIDARVANK